MNLGGKRGVVEVELVVMKVVTVYKRNKALHKGISRDGINYRKQEFFGSLFDISLSGWRKKVE